MTPALDADLIAELSAEITSGRPIGVAVSGGSDSTALLLLLSGAFAPEHLRAATVDHALRAEAAEEAEAVGELCAARGIGHQTLRWTGWDGQGNLPDAARRARYGLLADWATGQGVRTVALGHTRDDNSETFVMGLSRGAGLDGLSGMRPAFTRGGVTFLRPLLGSSRAALRDYLTTQDTGWIDDPSNADPRYERVRTREALATLEDLGVSQDRLAHAIGNLRDTRAAIAEHLSAWSRTHVLQQHGDLILDPEDVAALPRDFARRLLVAALRWVSGADHPPRADAMLQALAPDRPPALTLHGCLITFGKAIRITREAMAAARAAPAPPGETWDSRWRLTGPETGEVRALTETGLAHCPDWRDAGLPRPSLAASPALWQDAELIAAPLANLPNGHHAQLIQGRDDFPGSFISR